jgi:hypothetical protein
VRGDGGSVLGGIPTPAGLAMNWGILARPLDRLWLGVSWQHVFPLLGHGAGYEQDYATPSATGAQVTAAPGSGAPCGPGPCTGGDEIAFALPDVFHLGARVQVREGLELSTWARLVLYGGYGTSSDPALRGLVVRLSSSAARAGTPEQLVIDHALRPAFAAETGLRWRPRKGLRLGLSLAGETSAVPERSVDAEALDAPKVDATVAGEWRPLAWLRLLLSYGLTAYFPVAPSPGAFDPNARLRCADGASSLDACADDLAGRGLPTAAGTYTLFLHHLTAGAALDF